jgi:hypothetical protein
VGAGKRVVESLPLVTVVTPSLNQGPFIRDTIESVLAQDYPNVEYLVQDGGSTDETIEILAKYGKTVDWMSEPDRSQSDAINKGFRRGRGDIFSWINSDDFLLPGAIWQAVEAFHADPSLGLVYGDGYVVDQDSGHYHRVETPEPNPWDLSNLHCYVFQPSSFFRSEAFWGVGGLDDGLRWVMDYDLFIRISKRYPTAHVPAAWAVQRVYDDCLTMSGGLPRYREMASLVRRHSGRRNPPACPRYLSETLIRNFEQGLRRVRLPTTTLEHAAAATNRRVAYVLQEAMRRVYVDGWVKRRCELWLARGAGNAVEIGGETPDHGDRGLRLRVTIDGSQQADLKLDPGPFRVVCPIPPAPEDGTGPGVSDGPVRVRFEADRSFVPTHRPGGDHRRVAWRLTSLRCVDSRRVELPRPLGWYGDGWAGPIVRLTVRAGEGAVELRGELPLGYPLLAGQRLTLRAEQRDLRHIELQPGPFVIPIDLPDSGSVSVVDVMAARWMVPADEGIGADRRRLSYVLHELRAASNERGPRPDLPLTE